MATTLNMKKCPEKKYEFSTAAPLFVISAWRERRNASARDIDVTDRIADSVSKVNSWGPLSVSSSNVAPTRFTTSLYSTGFSMGPFTVNTTTRSVASISSNTWTIQVRYQGYDVLFTKNTVPMEGFIRNRLNDPRFNSTPVQVRTGREVTQWAPLDTTVTRINASGKNMTMHHDSYKSNSPKKRKKEDGDSSDSKSGNDSGKDSGNKSPKKKKKRETREGGKAKNDPCWPGYERDYSKEAGKSKSCVKM